MMSTRPLDFLDLPMLYRYRGEAISLDSNRLLTRGTPLGAAGFLSYFNPARHVYTAICQEDGASLLGGVIQNSGDIFARLFYIAPLEQLSHPAAPGLIEHLVAEAGRWGAFHVLAELEENSPAFPALRTAGFSVYAWQRNWDVSHLVLAESHSVWQRAKSVNLPAIQSLYHQIVPPLLQPVESTPKRAAGMVCSDGANCYVSVTYGVYGIVLSPLIHPEASNVAEKLAGLLNQLPARHGRPVYMCVRSYQAWLEPVIEDLGGKAASRQAVMVKHLAHMLKDEQVARAPQPIGVRSAQPSRVSPVEIHKK